MKYKNIIEGDSVLVLEKFEDETFDIVITSPPYNAAHNYDNYNDDREIKDYLLDMERIFRQTFRVLKQGGRICVNVPFAIKNKNNKSVFFIAHHISEVLNKIGFKNFEYISWHKGENLQHFQGNNTAWGSWKSPSCPSFRPLGESVLVFYKGDRVHKGNKENIDITGEEFKEWTKNSWYLDEKNGKVYENLFCIPNNSSKKSHPTPFPEELVRRILKLYSYKRDIVLDPFNGIGTTTKVASDLNRNFVGIDLSKKYCDMAFERIKNKGAFRITYDSEASKYVNSSNVKNTLNKYFPYKEGFSPELIPYLMKRYNIDKIASMIDPFLGTGSIFLNEMDMDCYGYDTSNLAINISNAKLVKLAKKDYYKIKEKCNAFNDKDIVEYSFPKWNPYPKYAPRGKFNIISSFIDFFEDCSEEAYRFVKFIVISNLESFFDYKRDGNGIKYRQSKVKEEDLILNLQNLILEATNKKEKFDKKNKKNLFFKNESSIDIEGSLSFDTAITSPPYVNMFDYFEVYKMELWTSGIVDNYSNWRTMKKNALRSNKNSNLIEDDIIDNNLLKDARDKLIKKGAKKATLIMINNYFFDINKVIQNLYNGLKEGGYVFIVVGNSFYSGVPIITDEIISMEASKMGFEAVDLIVARKLKTSSQQMKVVEKSDYIYMRESIIVLKKRRSINNVAKKNTKEKN